MAGDRQLDQEPAEGSEKVIDRELERQKTDKKSRTDEAAPASGGQTEPTKPPAR